jgi:hypothetical protein
MSSRAPRIPTILIYKEYKEFNRQVKEVEEVFRGKNHFFLSFSLETPPLAGATLRHTTYSTSR